LLTFATQQHLEYVAKFFLQHPVLSWTILLY
jgi:hypothetical protein